MNNNLLYLFAFAVVLTAAACNTNKTATTTPQSTSTEQQPRRGGERPDPSKMYARMDVNKDGKIATSEAKGRMAENFKTIDADADGFITMEEMK